MALEKTGLQKQRISLKSMAKKPGRKFRKYIGKLKLSYWLRFGKTSCWDKIDYIVVNELLDSIPHRSEGGLLSGEDGAAIFKKESVKRDFFDSPQLLCACEQIRFLTSIFNRIRPRRILEVGTHMGMFDYVIHLYDKNIGIDTFGNLPESQRSINILNEKFGRYINFHLGDSRQTLKDFLPKEHFDFAWVDGGHAYDVCTSDLVNCDRLGILNIGVDDYLRDEDVRRAVHDFTSRFNYVIAGKSNPALDGRGIVILRKNR